MIRTFRNIKTGIVIQVTAEEYDRFFDNRCPFEWEEIDDIIGVPV